MTSEVGWTSLGVVPTLDGRGTSSLGRQLDSGLARVGRDSGKRFGGILGKAALATAGGIFAGGYAAFRIGKDALGEAREAQEIGATSAAILKSTQHAANLNRREYDALTESLMRKTAIDDEQIAQGGNLLLTFKNVKREGKGLKDIFGRALASSLDIAATGFTSNTGAAKQLGKALNDPVKGTTALTKAGVTFTEGQTKTIESMVKHNNTLGAQKIILKEVESQVGGTAAAQKTSAKELETAWGNVKEEVGFALIPVMDDLADVMLDKGIPAARDFAGWLRDDAIPAARDFTEEIKPLAEKALPAAGDALGIIHDAGKKALPFIEGIVDAFNDMPKWAQTLVVGGFGAGALAKKTGLLGSLFGKKGGLVGSVLGGAAGSKPTNPLFVAVVNGGVGIGDGSGGVGGKGKGGPVGALAKGTLGRFLGLASLNFLLSGDSAPNDVKDRPKTEQAYIRLIELVGAEQGKFTETLVNATADELKDWRQTLLKEFGIGFGKIAQLQVEGGGTAIPDGLTARDQNRRGQNLRDIFAEGTKFEGLLKKIPNRVETKFFTPGLVDSQTDVDKLIRRFDLDLDGREIKTLYKLLGVDQAISDFDRLLAKANEVERRLGSDNIAVDPEGPGRSNQGGQVPGTGLSLNVQNMTVNDGRDLAKAAGRHHRRMQTDNVRSNP